VDRYALTLNLREQIQRAILQQEIYATKSVSFNVTFLNVFDQVHPTAGNNRCHRAGLESASDEVLAEPA
jgi:hypothetical protein